MQIKNSKTTDQDFNPANLTTVAKLAKSRGVTRKTVYNWVRTGRIVQRLHLEKLWVDVSTYRDRELKGPRTTKRKS